MSYSMQHFPAGLEFFSGLIPNYAGWRQSHERHIFQGWLGSLKLVKKVKVLKSLATHKKFWRPFKFGPNREGNNPPPQDHQTN